MLQHDKFDDMLQHDKFGIFKPFICDNMSWPSLINCYKLNIMWGEILLIENWPIFPTHAVPHRHIVQITKQINVLF